MKYNQMLGMFFTHKGEISSRWTIKGHAKKRYWQWLSTWARAIRRPSDIGYDDGDFVVYIGDQEVRFPNEKKTEHADVIAAIEDAIAAEVGIWNEGPRSGGRASGF